MAEVEVTISSAEDLENVNWRYGLTRPYAMVCVDPNNKMYTRADEEGDISPHWNETLTIPLLGSIHYNDTTLYIDILHAGCEQDTKKLIGSARLRLQEVLKGAGYGKRTKLTLQLKRPSGKPRGKVHVKVSIREPGRAPPVQVTPYGAAPPLLVSPHGAAAPAQGISYYAAQPPPVNLYGYQASPYYAAQRPPVNLYGYQASPSAGYPPLYHYQASPLAGYPNEQAPKKNKFGKIVNGALTAFQGITLAAAFTGDSTLDFLGGC